MEEKKPTSGLKVTDNCDKSLKKTNTETYSDDSAREKHGGCCGESTESHE